MLTCLSVCVFVIKRAHCDLEEILACGFKMKNELIRFWTSDLFTGPGCYADAMDFHEILYVFTY